MLNSLTHGVGLGLSLAGGAILIVLAALHATRRHIAGIAIYIATLIVLYACSTLYHACRRPRWKHALRLLDHSAIYLLIAGTYTPFALVNLHGHWGAAILIAVWTLALAGIVGRSTFGMRFAPFAMVLYILTGWLAVLAIKPMLQCVPAGGLLWLLAGGISYTSGLVFFGWKRCPYNHAVWHVFVLGGSACHYLAVLLYVLPVRPNL